MKHVVLAALIGLPVLASAQSGMKGMDMKDMDRKGMKSDKQAAGQVHKGTGLVTKVDRAGGKVTLKHEPIQSLNWPTMTMAFGVKDGQQFVITSIK